MTHTAIEMSPEDRQKQFLSWMKEVESKKKELPPHFVGVLTHVSGVRSARASVAPDSSELSYNQAEELRKKATDRRGHFDPQKLLEIMKGSA